MLALLAFTPTPTVTSRVPITVPKITAPTLASAPLPAGRYVFTLALPPHDVVPGVNHSETVTLTRTGTAMALVDTGAPNLATGTVSTTGAVNFEIDDARATMVFTGQATGANASGDILVTPTGAQPIAGGHFTLATAGPEIRAQENGPGWYQALVHAVRCWLGRC